MGKRVWSLVAKYVLYTVLFSAAIHVCSNSDKESDMGSPLSDYTFDVVLTTFVNLSTTPPQKGLTVKYDIRDSFTTYPFSTEDGSSESNTYSLEGTDVPLVVLFVILLLAAVVGEVAASSQRFQGSANWRRMQHISSMFFQVFVWIVALAVVINVMSLGTNPVGGGQKDFVGACGMGTIQTSSAVNTLLVGGHDLSVRSNDKAHSVFSGSAYTALSGPILRDIATMSENQKKQLPDCVKAMSANEGPNFQNIGQMQNNVAFIKQNPSFAVLPGIVAIRKQASALRSPPAPKFVSYYYGSTMVTLQPRDVLNSTRHYNETQRDACVVLTVCIALLSIYFVVHRFYVDELTHDVSNKIGELPIHKWNIHLNTIQYAFIVLVHILTLIFFILLVLAFEDNREAATTNLRRVVETTFICQCLAFLVFLVAGLYVSANEDVYQKKESYGRLLWASMVSIHISYAVIFIYYCYFKTDDTTVDDVPTEITEKLNFYVYFTLIPIIIHYAMQAFDHVKRVDRQT